MFSASHSASSLPYSFLENPPLASLKFDLCGVKNSIFMYDLNVSVGSVFRSDVRGFNQEELSRGVYEYNCELNKWFPLPSMKQKVKNACITTSNDIIYMIGGKADDGLSNYAQTYDFRMETWQNLLNTKYPFENGACCAHRGKIYVAAPSSSRKIKMLVFDPLAGRWEFSEPSRLEVSFIENGIQDIRLVSNGNKLCLLIAFFGNKYNVYKVSDGSEVECVSSFNNVLAELKHYRSSRVLDAFVF